MFRLLACSLYTLIASFFFSTFVDARECISSYTVKRGDTLSRIARLAYDDARKWSLIYNANLETIGTNPHLIQIGMIFRVPCLQHASVEEREVGGAAGKSVKLLTADDYAPFTDRSLQNGGLITSIVNAALSKASGVQSYGIDWINDWSVHLDPLLANQTYDLGFPWLQPDCAQNSQRFRCQNFLFSEPMFEMLVLLFVDKNNPVNFESDDDIIGRTLCRPEGYYTHDLEKDGRRWLSDNRIELEQPSSVKACFDLLVAGKVDAVALNEFTGRSAIKDLGLETRVEIIKTRPLSIEGLHVLVHKSHPRAQELIVAVNNGLQAIKESGDYQSIVDRHLAAFWDKF